MNLRLALIVGIAVTILAVAGGLYLKGRRDAAARVQPKLEAAVAKAAVAGLETQGAQQSAQRVEAAVRQRDAAAGTVAQVTARVLTSEEANAPLSSDRASRLHDADRQLCVADPELAGCAADPNAG
jgi:hypothetical protein